MASFTTEQIENALTAKAAHLSAPDIRRIADNRQAVERLIDEFPAEWESAKEQASLLFQFIQAAPEQPSDAELATLKLAAGALIYLGDPLDIVPDDQEDGYEDDAAVVELASQKIRPALAAFCQAQGRVLPE